MDNIILSTNIKRCFTFFKRVDCLALILIVMTFACRVGAEAVMPTGAWIGQEGHDFTSPGPVLEGNDVQDVLIQVRDLPVNHQIVAAKLTGFGGGEWNYNGAANSWKIKMDRVPGSGSADFYFDPGNFDTARQWNIEITFDNGEKANVSFMGTRTNPDRRMPNASVTAVWVGQDGSDLTGRGPSVGPDGRQDVHILLSHLSAKVAIEAIQVSVVPFPSVGSSTAGSHSAGSSSLIRWAYGLNQSGSWNAELIRHQDDPSQADLFFSPNENLKDYTLQLKILYIPGQGDTTTLIGRRTDPLLPVPSSRIVEVKHVRLPITWKGQDGQGANRGDIHIRVGKLPAVNFLAIELSDPVGGTWTMARGQANSMYVPPAGEEIQPPLPLDFRANPADGSADLYFPPFRNEAHSQMTLRFVYETGLAVVTQFPGGQCDPYLRNPAPSSGSVIAHPGDDLNLLANQFGTIKLTRGLYPMNRALQLNHPITISGEPGATVVFSQQPGDSSLWQTAIKIGCSNTRLESFAVRFATPIHWQAEDYINGAAVLGTVKQSPGHQDPGCNIVIANMDIESSPLAPGAPPDDPAWAIPAANGGRIPSTPRLMRFIWATSGKILHNTLRGGTCDVMHGPWLIADNEYRGTTVGAFTYDVFAAHYCHDVSVLGNRIHVVGASGKTWRFLTMTQAGDHDIVQDNDVRDIGIRDNDTVPNPNAPEILLTEAYRLHFEGRPAFISSQGFVIGIPALQGAPVRTGNVVAILTGPYAGKFFRIAQAIAPTVFLMDSPLPTGQYDVSIATGFMEEDYEHNTIDMRGSSRSGDFILAGNHFGPHLIGNHMLGGNDSLILSATPTEAPNIWGWSHAPLLGAIVEGNVFEDAVRGTTLHVEHNRRYIKSNSGRVYMTAKLRQNKVRWSNAFLAQHPEKKGSNAGYITVGDADSLYPRELMLQTEDYRGIFNRSGSETQLYRIIAASVNGKDRIEMPVTPRVKPW